MSKNWQGVVSLVLSKAEGRLASSAGPTPTTSAEQPRLASVRSSRTERFVNTDGLLIGDRPVVAKAQLIYRFPWGLMVSLNVQHQTGRF